MIRRILLIGAILAFGSFCTSQADNLLVNPGFETGLDGWWTNGEIYTDGPPHSGIASAVISAYEEWPYADYRTVAQDVSVEAEVLYFLEFWYMNQSPGVAHAALYFLDENNVIIGGGTFNLDPSYEEWTFHQHEAEAPPETAYCSFRVTCTVIGENIWGYTYLDDTALIPESFVSVPGDEMSVQAHREPHLAPNWPNPFNPSTEISFTLLKATTVSLQIYDISGRLVCSLVAGEEFSAGKHQLTWNGTNSEGQQLVSGVYFCRLEVGEYTETKKMTLLK